MKAFLSYVAEDLLLKYGTNLSHVAVVFPNKRASLFLNDHLVQQAGKPLWSPAYITISELFRQQSDLQVADSIKLICDLHKSFCAQTQSTETLDKFYGWGQLLLSDFDDIDKNMADPDHVLSNVRDIHELDDISYLTEEQRQMLSRFFSNFSEESNSELKERFLNFWSHLSAIYHDFNKRLNSQGLAYEGGLYRKVASAVDRNDIAGEPTPTGPTHPNFPYDHYVFVGFNLLQKVEQRLFSSLQKMNKAHFYWDYDNYYLQGHEAGQYINRYLAYFPNELDLHADDIYSHFNKPKHISYIAAATENIQARYLATWLQEDNRYKDGRRTAIVLCDETLLPVVIHCIPEVVEAVNITTGYPLSQTPVASFIHLWFNLWLQGHTSRLLRIFRHHPYAKYITEEEEDVITSGLPSLALLLRQIAQNGSKDIDDPLFQESLFRAYSLVNRLNNLQSSGDLTVDNITLQRLVGQLIQQTSIPFHGEPAEGLQVMGVLETRNLDFDHVLLLSCNEGNLPKGINDSSFIPHNIRRAYELTTVENKVSIYAYYFYRLLQRAGDVTILYNNSTEDGQQGEMSRFMLQLMVESKHPIKQHTLQTGQDVSRWQPQPIRKSEPVMKTLADLYMQPHSLLSPSAINKYLRCPLLFYYYYVAGIREPDLPDDDQELDNRTFGNIFHQAADSIYHQLPRDITKVLLEHLLKSKVEIERAVDEAFHQELPYMPNSGLHLINREVIIQYLRQLIAIDCRLAPFTILGLECDVKRSITLQHAPFPITIGGRIDRLDLMNDGTVRVIDYKTGSGQLKPLPNVEAIFHPENIPRHADYYLQTFIYADIVSRQQSYAQLTHTPTFKVSPALLFIQHASGEGYDPTLCFGKEPIRDIASHAARFNELLEEKVGEIFSADIAFNPTTDLRVCRLCPYAPLCRR